MWIISFWIFPVIGSCMWLAMLLTMLIQWAAVEGRPHYESMELSQTIAFISDVGAHGLKPLFITGCSITSVVFSASFVSERWLRHRGQLARNRGRADKTFAIISIVFSMCGGLGLILLSIFDTVRFPLQHNGCLVLFMGGYILSAIFVCAEYQRLGIHYREHTILAASFWIKLVFILVELALAVAFGVTGQQGMKNQAAVLEWIIAYIFTFYVLSFVVDLLPAIRTRNHIPQGKRITEMTMAQNGAQQSPSTMTTTTPRPPQTSAYYEQPLTTDSMGDRGNVYRGYVVDQQPTQVQFTQSSAGGYVPYGQSHAQEGDLRV
ncbi:suppressor Sfk1 [Blastomyces dermatitidis ER-3]|uniref:Suppressor Sfk1 n=2 Tax=Ajellomyces dermatitidis TaxID=5039 RepID=F2T2Q1_AJEDA|nr:suppressor Sfk1 [Blastomyces dermatitidis ER-3]EEQ88670.2 suppressor Sfk1 [Blastomyces dermatitidis ER-3]EGE77161.1 suppressor Sfk1 [Blastomyces dermatitidis ATCC 18188]